MSAIGRKRGVSTKKAGIVTSLPGLPYPLFQGRITWSDEFDGQPTGTIEYEGLTEQDIAGVQAAYRPGMRVAIFGIPFIVKRFGYSRVPADTEEDIIDIFSATVGLETPDPGQGGGVQGISVERARMFGYMSYTGPVSMNASMNLGGANAAQDARSTSISATVGAPATDGGGGGWSGGATGIAVSGQGSKTAGTVSSSAPFSGGVRAGLGTVFSRDEIIVDGLNEIQLEDPEYNDVVLDGGWNDDDKKQDQDKTPPVGTMTVFTLVPPERKETEEYSKDHTKPPENTVVLRDDTSQNFDENGQKKFYRRSETVNGQPSREVFEAWGFAYLYRDIQSSNRGKPELYSEEPERFWRKVEYREVSYIYQAGGESTYAVKINTKSGKPVNFGIHPDYTDFASASIDGLVTVKSQAEYLVEVRTEGWKLCRLKKEEITGMNTIEVEKILSRRNLRPKTKKNAEDWKKVLEFRQVPFTARSVYLLDSVKSAQGGDSAPPFTIEYVDYEDADDRVKKLFQKQYSPRMKPKALMIGVIKPDPSFAEPFFVKQEASASNSFIWADDPDGEVDPDKVIPGTNRPLPPPRLLSGEESYNEVVRTVTGPDTFTELLTEYSSQDPGFDNSIERVTVSEKTGSPPSPTTRTNRYESKQVRLNDKMPTLSPLVEHVANTEKEKKPGGTDRPQDSDEKRLNYPEAKSPDEAKVAAETDLRKQGMQNSQTQKTIFGFHPYLKAGQPIACEGDRFAGMGQWRIVSVTWTLEYKGVVDDFGLLVTTPGTQVRLGLDKHIPVRMTTRPKPDAQPNGDGDNNSKDDPVEKVDLVYYPGQIGRLLDGVKTRRNY